MTAASTATEAGSRGRVLPDPRLVEFVRQYAGGAQGGEPRADCAHGSTVAQEKAAQAKAASTGA